MFNAVEYINTPRWQNVSLGLGRTQRLLELLGNPHKSLKFVHVAGTNGKGSTCAFLESIFRASGLKTGLFTSPFLMCFEDRIRVNNANISKRALTDITLKVKDAAEKVEAELWEHPTEFELMTAVAFKHFAREKCDIVVCEVGLGGRLDSTNVITPEVSVITHIGLDHMAILGNTIEEIAFEKAGIIKQNVPVVLAPQEDKVFKVVEEVAENLNAPLVALRKTVGKPSSELASLFLLSESKMKGKYQVENAKVAAEVARLLGVDEASIKTGLQNSTWPGRFEVFEGDDPLVIVDGAHNVDGARALRESLALYDDSEIAVFGALKDKDVAGIVDEVGELFDRFFVYEVDSPRAMEVDELASLTKKYAETEVASSAENALVKALDFAKEKGHQNLIVCFGSLYSIGDIRRYLLKNRC